MTHRPTLRALLLCATLALRSSVAHADTGSIAEELFREARQAMQENDYASACPKFAESQRLDPSVGTLLNIALCEEHTGRIAAAWGHFRTVIDQLPPHDRRMPIAESHLKALDPRVPKLKLAIQGPRAAEVDVDLDGTVLLAGAFGSELPIEPGRHVIALRGSGVKSSQLELEIAEGEHLERTLEVELAPEVPAVVAPLATPVVKPAAPKAVRPPARSATSAPTHDAQRSWGYATATVGVAALATSALLGGLALHEQSIVSRHCPENECDAEGLSAGKRGSRLETWANVSFGLGLLGVGGGVYLVLSAPVSAGTPRALARPMSLQIRGSF